MSSTRTFNVTRVIAIGLLAMLAPLAQAEIIKGKPDAIVCSVKDPVGALPWERLVFFVSAHTRNGETLYKSSTSDPVVLLVSAEGVVNAPNLADCDGQSIEALSKAKRAFTFTPPR